MQKIVLDVVPNGIEPRIYVNQYDIGRQFQISFKEGFGSYYFENGVTFKINGRKADNHVFEYTENDRWDSTHYVITKSGSGASTKVTIGTTEQMVAAAGETKAQLTFHDSTGATVGTLNFIIVVQERPEASGDPSESDAPGVVRIVDGMTPDGDGAVTLNAISVDNISTVEDTNVMTHNHAAGSYLYVASDRKRYKVGANAINAGTALTPGTNANERYVDQDIEQLNSDIVNVANAVTQRTLQLSSNLNTPLSTGDYTFSIYRYDNNTSNTPVGGTGVAITWSSSPNYGSQIAFNDSHIYFRTKAGSSTPSAWATVI